MREANIEELKNGYAELVERAHDGERVLIVKGRSRKPWAVLGPVEDKGVSVTQMISDAEKLRDELMRKHDGDLDAVMRDLIALSQAASTATALVEQERRRRGEPDHK